MSLIAPPQQLYEILTSILVGRGWRYLRYLHFRSALQMAQGTRSVLSVGAGKGLAEVALALEHPQIEFTISERPSAMKGLRRAKKLSRRLGLSNVRFSSVDLLSRRLPFRRFDLVAAVDTLQYIADSAIVATRLALMSDHWVYCQVPFAEEARRKNLAATERAFKEFGHYCLGYDVNQLVRLFPEPVAIRGCLWSNAGQRLRERLQERSDEQIQAEADALLAQAEEDSRPGWPGDRAEAQGIWILSRAPQNRAWSFWSRLKAGLGLGLENPYSRDWEKLDDRRIIEISGLFDEAFYRHSIDDAEIADPLGHYLLAPEAGGWPNAQFDSAYYARRNRLSARTKNPLVHYILEGRARRLPTAEMPGAAARTSSYANVTQLHAAPAQSNRDVAEATPLRPAISLASPVATAPSLASAPVCVARSVTEVRRVIEASGLFDPEFYRAQNPDIVKRQAEPLGHYLRSGAREGRNPNPLFDSRYYTALAKLDPQSQNPLLHYIMEGEAGGIAPSIRFEPAAYRAANPRAVRPGRTLLAHALRELREHAPHAKGPSPLGLAVTKVAPVDLRQLRITVVIPVYNGGEHVRRCIDSVLTETRLPQVELLVLDDASTDANTVAILGTYATCPNVRVRRNAENLGFTQNVNTAFASEAKRDIVLLNSDTVVGPRWLEHLALAAHSDLRIASATALSDNAGAFSTPEVDYNSTHARFSVPTAARLSRRAAPQEAESFATGNGFCMYLRHEALHEVGFFDAELFPRGYGEENEWCMRATELGFRHVLALRSYVMHVNAVSFGPAKLQLTQDARRALDSRHPHYTQQLKAGIANAQALRTQRAEFASALSATPEHVMPRVLFVISTRTGGVPQTNGDLMRGLSPFFAPLLLQCNSTELTLAEAGEGDHRVLETHHLHERVSIRNHTSDEYDATVRDWLLRYDVELVHVRHIAWHSLGLVKVAKSLGIPVVLSFHDFYTLCPSVNLVGSHERWSASGVFEPHIVAPLWREVDPDGMQSVRGLNARAFLESWRRRMSLMVDQCDALVTTSESAKAILQSQLPAARRSDVTFEVVAHGRDFETFLAPPSRPLPSEPLRVLAPGNISEAKGLGTLLKLLELDVERGIELHVMGACPPSLSEQRGVINHGRYRREQFFDLVNQIRPHLSVILSICPETFCHTLTESWAAGIPVVGSELGAVGERIAASQAGWLVDPLDADSVLRRLLAIRADAEDFSEKTGAVVAWQRTTGATRTVARMSDDYLDLYRRTLSSNRPLLPSKGRIATGRPRVAVVAQGQYPESPATVHVRVATPINASNAAVCYDWTDAREFVRTTHDYDGVLVCRNAADETVMKQVARAAEQQHKRLVVDVDDDLLNVPSDKDVGGIYSARADGLKAVLRAAALTTVSTGVLASTFAGHTKVVRIAENRLDAQLWLGPVEPRTAPSGYVAGAALKVIYVGSPTHAEDLSLVLPVFRRLEESHRIALHVVGVENTDRRGYVRLRAPERRYDRFVPWLRSIMGHFDVAIAPLVDSHFNHGKSPLKFMEYSACGIPTIASRVPPYADFVNDGVDGLLAGDDTEWEHHLVRLLDTNFRRRLAQAALTRCVADFVCNGSVMDTFDWRSEPIAATSELR